MAAGDGFAELLREQLAPLGPLSLRRMFGKTGVFCGGVMFGMVQDGALYLRVEDDSFAKARSQPPLSYEKRGCGACRTA